MGLTPVPIGPPGVGKSLLARKFAADTGRSFNEVFFDDLMRPGYLAGSFDPAMVLQKGYCQEASEEGPLILSRKTAPSRMISFSRDVGHNGDSYRSSSTMSAAFSPLAKAPSVHAMRNRYSPARYRPFTSLV